MAIAHEAKAKDLKIRVDQQIARYILVYSVVQISIRLYLGDNGCAIAYLNIYF